MRRTLPKHADIALVLEGQFLAFRGRDVVVVNPATSSIPSGSYVAGPSVPDGPVVHIFEPVHVCALASGGHHKGQNVTRARFLEGLRPSRALQAPITSSSEGKFPKADAGR